MHPTTEPESSSPVEQCQDRLFSVDQNLFRWKTVRKFPVGGAFAHQLNKENGLICIHPVSGIIADYVYSTNEIHFLGFDGIFIKRHKLSNPMLSFQWLGSTDESLLCYFSNFQVQLIDFHSLGTTVYKLADALKRNLAQEPVISSTCIGKNSHVYCMLSSGELFDFFSWKPDGSFQILIYETGIKFCVELCAPVAGLLYGYNKSWLHRIELADSSQTCTKLIESFLIVSPIFSSCANVDVFAVVVADQKEQSLCHLKVYDVSKREFICSLKLAYMPEGVFFFPNNSFIIANQQSCTIVNRHQCKEIECFENVHLIQIVPTQCIVLGQSGIDLVSFSSKLLERLKHDVKASLPFSPDVVAPSVKMLETVFDVALSEWNREEQRVLVQVAQQISCFLCVTEYDQEKITKCTKFLEFVNNLRHRYNLGCFFVHQGNMESLVNILLSRNLVNSAIDLFSIFFFEERIAEKVFSTWITHLSNNASTDYAAIAAIQTKLSIPSQRLAKIIAQSGRKDLLLKLLPFVQESELMCMDISNYSNPDIVRILRNLSNECKISQCYQLVEGIVEEFSKEAKPRLFSIFAMNKDISRFFEDYCLYHIELWPLLSKYYYSLDSQKLQSKVDQLIRSKVCISSTTNELVTSSELLQEFQAEISCANSMPEILNMSFLETCLLVRSSTNPSILYIFEENFPLAKCIPR